MNGRDFLQSLFFSIAVKPFMALFIGIRVRGYENLPSSDPFILVANHSSHLDTISLLNLFPLMRLRKIRPVAAADYFEKNAWISWISKTFFNILPIARKNITQENNPVDQMKACIESGQSLIIFPEGTRNPDGEMGVFHSGLAHLLGKVGAVQVIPAYLVNMGRSLPKGEFIPVPFFCEIRLGKPLILRGNRKEIMSSLETAIRDLIDWKN